MNIQKNLPMPGQLNNLNLIIIYLTKVLNSQELFLKEILNSYSINYKNIAMKNPQTNNVIECIYGILGEILWTYELLYKKQVFDKNDPQIGFLTSIAWVLLSTIYTTLNITPAELVFGRDMIIPLQFKLN